MNVNVVNRELKVGQIKMNGVSSSALFLIGDANFLILSSILDTPFETVTEGPFVPLVTDVPPTQVKETDKLCYIMCLLSKMFLLFL